MSGGGLMTETGSSGGEIEGHDGRIEDRGRLDLDFLKR